MNLDEIRNGKPCPDCKGTGRVERISFQDASKKISSRCLECKGGRIGLPSEREKFLLNLLTWRPLASEPWPGPNKIVFLLGDSGLMSTPYRIELGKYCPDKRCFVTIDHGTRWTDGGSEPTHWMPYEVPSL